MEWIYIKLEYHFFILLKKKNNKTKQNLCKLKITTCLGFTALYFLLFLGKKKKEYSLP